MFQTTDQPFSSWIYPLKTVVFPVFNIPTRVKLLKSPHENGLHLAIPGACAGALMHLAI